MESLGVAFPKEQARLRECLQHGRELGPAGMFYCTVIEQLLQRADQAVMRQDLTSMILIY